MLILDHNFEASSLVLAPASLILAYPEAFHILKVVGRLTNLGLKKTTIIMQTQNLITRPFLAWLELTCLAAEVSLHLALYLPVGIPFLQSAIGIRTEKPHYRWDSTLLPQNSTALAIFCLASQSTRPKFPTSVPLAKIQPNFLTSTVY